VIEGSNRRFYCDPATGPTRISGRHSRGSDYGEEVPPLPNLPTRPKPAAGVGRNELVFSSYGMYAPRDTPKTERGCMVDACSGAKDPA